MTRTPEAEAARNAALEEAAAECEARAAISRELHFVAQANEAIWCAREIRALKSTPAGDGETTK